jgi:hypothetical protein
MFMLARKCKALLAASSRMPHAHTRKRSTHPAMVLQLSVIWIRFCRTMGGAMSDTG